MMPAPIPDREAERLAALRAYAVLDTPPEESFDRITRLAAAVFDVPVAIISFVDAEREWFKSACGTTQSEGPRDLSFCGHAIHADEVMVVEDALQDDRFRDNPLVTSGERTRFYAGAPLRTKSGVAVGVLCLRSPLPRSFGERDRAVLRDLAALATSELDARVVAEAARLACTARSRFFSNLSHELRTPMTAIVGFADMVTQAGLTATQQADAICTIRRNCNHLLGLLSDVLDLAKLESGHVELCWSDVLVADVFSDLRSMFEWRAFDKGLSLEFDVACDMPSMIRADRVRLLQILINLVSNAIKYTERGSVVLRATYDAMAHRMTVEVHDTGVGIDACFLQRMFLPFEQASRANSVQAGGVGLGLAITKTLCDAMGGRITVTSTPGAGSVFTVELPVTLVAQAGTGGGTRRNECACEPHAAGANRDKPLLGCHVLVAEDGPDNQRLISFLLERAGARVTLVGNGAEALQRLKQEPGVHDVVLMDMQMPVLDGYDATLQIRALGLSIPVIALTAHAMVGDREECLQAGCDSYLTKPIDREKLVATLVQWCGRPAVGAAA